jgi:tetratricopeptide (TPR) repeat protein
MSIAQNLEQGIDHHRAGNLAEAERHYRTALAIDPQHPEALHLLGVLAHHAGHLPAAIDLLLQAITLRPQAGHFYNSLGNAFRDQGDLTGAQSAYREALCLEPRSVEAQSNLGNVLRDLGQLEEAIAAYRQAIEWQPGDADLHSNLGNVLRESGRLTEALESCHTAVTLDPAHAAAHGNLGDVLRDLRRLEEASAAYRRATDLQPDFLNAFVNGANTLLLRGRIADGTAAFRQIANRWPASAEAHDGLGHALREAGDLAGAVAEHRRGIELAPQRAAIHLNLAVALSEQGDWDEAFTVTTHAWQIAPKAPETRLAQAHLLLARGEYASGLPLYEARWDAPGFRALHTPLPHPRWDGRPLSGQRVLIRAEQGFGDSIQFIRYAAAITKRGGVVAVECQPALVELFRSAPGVSSVAPTGGALPDCEFQVPMLSLPLVCETTLATIPSTVPYLTADAEQQTAWEARLGPREGRLRVGLAWMGSRDNAANSLRSIPLETLAPLFTLTGIDFVSLQIGAGAEQIANSPNAHLIDLTAELTDFSATAALLASLDLVIAVDSAVLHLAGAMGRSAWAMLRFAADWRWLQEREDSPWYPTLRLFRQPSYRAWEPVVAEIKGELLRWRENFH